MEFKLFGKCIYVKKVMLAVMVVLAALLIGSTGLMISRSREGIIFDTKDNATSNFEAASTVGTTSTEGATNEIEEVVEEIKVYVVGCVKTPGIITLKKGQVIDDAVKAAGGATVDADLENINLVYRLYDNVMLKIRSKKESIQVPAAAVQKPAAKPVTKPAEAGKGAVIVKDSGGALVEEIVDGVKAGGKVNINTASIDELDTLPYIGIETAKDIIAYREGSGKFKVIEDIMKVSGIKESRFGKIKDLICVN